MLASDPESLSVDEIRDMGQTISQSGHALQRLIETFLAYSQLEMIRADPQKIASLRGKPTSAAAQLIEREGRRIAEEAGRPADLQLQLSPIGAPISEEYFAKLISELTHNAFKFSAAGTPVVLTLTAAPDATVLTVADRGRGLSADQITKIGAFMQFDRKTHEQQGLGLGLTIARRLAEVHGGGLAVQSELGVGTTVTVRLPIVK
jgi:signal transduction histidine kinase